MSQNCTSFYIVPDVWAECRPGAGDVCTSGRCAAPPAEVHPRDPLLIYPVDSLWDRDDGHWDHPLVGQHKHRQ